MREQLKFVAMVALVATAACSSSSDKTEEPGLTYRYALVANGNSNSVSVVSLATRTVTATIPVSLTFPWEITVAPNGKKAYVSCRGDKHTTDPGGISILDLVANEEIGTVLLSGYDPARSLLVGTNLYVGFAGYLDGGDTLVSVVDVSAASPEETDVLTIVSGSADGSLSLATDAANTKLYVGDWGSNVNVVDLATGEVTGTIVLNGNIMHSLTRKGNFIYAANEENDVIEAIDSSVDAVATTADVKLGTDGQMQAMVFEGTKAYVANDLGGVARIDLARNMDGLVWLQGDDSTVEVDLPFTFTFQGNDYTTAFLNTNGTAHFASSTAWYDDPLSGITGFAAVQQDLYSDDRVFAVAYNKSADGHRAVFEFSTAHIDDSSNPNTVGLYEIVLFSDGRARFDYWVAGPDAAQYDDPTAGYGVADGTDVLVNLRDDYGSPLELARTSLMWNPASPNTVTEVPFTWEGTGIDWIPLPGTPHDLVLADGYLITPLSNDAYYNTGDQIAFVKASTMEPAFLVTVESGPRAIALVK